MPSDMTDGGFPVLRPKTVSNTLRCTWSKPSTEGSRGWRN
ncbi:hypothetical protein SANTM175S_09191 [Streptomyces antimycoticus]